MSSALWCRVMCPRATRRLMSSSAPERPPRGPPRRALVPHPAAPLHTLDICIVGYSVGPLGAVTLHYKNAQL
ncbi:hypothetical protein PsYK624_153010 [Phanerochaete sordida]|uniref:Uncharacterized protein n=1 Tax=Phanerochaete sordida TaxID=48140 RepID=A0A9P3GQL6_9APHY|nr:hypothetical protein PsYK624_153010 [Phanerochaete sordida]